MERDVPYIAYEATIARFERALKRLTIALIICVLVLFATNLAWLLFFNQFEMESETKTITVDSTDGVANYIGNDGDIVNGEDSSSDSTQTDAEEER